MSVYTSQALQTTRSSPVFTCIRYDYCMVAPYNYEGYPASPIDKETYLAAHFMGKPADISSKFGCDEEVIGDTASVEIFKTSDLICL